MTGCQFGTADHGGTPTGMVATRAAVSGTVAPPQIQFDDGYWLGDRAVSLTPRPADAGDSAANNAAPAVRKADADPLSSPSLPVWTTTPGLRLRELLARWVDQANEAGCAAPDPCFKLADQAPDMPAEPWRILVADSLQGDFLTALAWLQEGFRRSPRPSIEVTKNNVVILSPLGATP